MNKVYFILSILFLSLTVFAQENGSPFITNFTEKEYKAQSQNWAIIEDQRGVIYGGNNGGVLEFDGVNWRLIKMPNLSVIRSLAVDDNNRIYVGAVDEFGYLESTINGELVYKSLSRNLDTTYQDFKSVWKIHITNRGVYFFTDYYLIKWTNNNFKFIYPKSDLFFLSYQINDDIYLFERDHGLLFLNDQDSLIVLKNQELLRKSRVFDMNLFEKEKILVNTLMEGLMIIQIQDDFSVQITKPENSKEADKLLVSNQGYDGCVLDSNHFVFSTLRDGIIIVNKQGQITEHIKKNHGLQNDQVWHVFVDRNKNIWCGLNSGISIVEWNIPIRHFGQSFDLKGTVLDITRFKNYLFTATSQGLYYFENNKFKELGEFKRHNWDLIIFEFDNVKKLLLGSTYGIFEIKVDDHNISTHRITDTKNNIYYLYQSKKNPSLVFAGLNSGLAVFQYKNGQFSDLNMIEGINEQIRMIEEDNNHKLWLQTAYNGVIKIDFDNFFIESDISKINEFDIHITKYNNEKGLPHTKDVIIYNHFNKLYFTTSQGIYSFNEEEELFSPLKSFGEEFSDGSFGVYRFIPDFKENFWITSNPFKPYGEILIKQEDESYRRDTISLKRVPYMDAQSLFHEENGVTWIGGTEGLYSVNMNKSFDLNNPFYALIRKVIINNDSTLFYGYKSKIEQKKPILDFKNNAIIFQYAASYYAPHKENKYSYLLEGFKSNNNTWSDWTVETKKEYTNLHEGEYTFKVKAKNIYGIESKIAIYDFTILPPWYRTWLAYATYLIIAIIFIYILILLNSRRLKNANKRLEEEVVKRTFEIEQQKEEIKSQAEQLVTINQELEKLSIVASETKNAIIIMDADGTIQWINNAYTKLYGYTLEELKERGENIIEVSTHPHIKNLLNDWIGSNLPIHFESLNKTKDGNRIWAQTTISPVLNKKDIITNLIAIDSDITELKETDELLRQKNADITDSISYASRIQHAITPPIDIINSDVTDSFVINLPKDIVSGDFCWFSKINQKLIIAVADCTGHGVPGAFMSMIGIVFLNKIVNEKNILDTKEILNRLRVNVTNALHKSGKSGESFDGMDISIISIDLEALQLSYSGAMNPIYLIQNNELKELTPDKMPIGIYDQLCNSFNSQQLKIEKGDQIYMFTDGYADQFGGVSGQKLRYSKFKKLILESSSLKMSEQKEKLLQAHNAWKADYEQVDDIILLGVKF